MRLEAQFTEEKSRLEAAVAALEQEKADALASVEQATPSEAMKAENVSMRGKLKKAIDTITKFKQFRDTVNKERADLKQKVCSYCVYASIFTTLACLETKCRDFVC